ncbi:hypothetical protein BH23CHL1_BH23CHL1_14750 [soil metagenome]
MKMDAEWCPDLDIVPGTAYRPLLISVCEKWCCNSRHFPSGPRPGIQFVEPGANVQMGA